MYLVDYTPTTPEENIALDELLLLKAEAGDMGESLRFWEANKYFVVLGRAGKIEDECFRDKCLSDGVKIIRRASGGGTVLEGPGCINYSAVLAYDSHREYRDIRGSYDAILGNICSNLGKCGYRAEIMPISDIAIGKKKISGNAQARKKKYFLHHGTFLYDFDIDKVSKYIKHPAAEPEYRKGRRHGAFISNIHLSSDEIKGAVTRSFRLSGDKQAFGRDSLADLKDLIDTKYALDSWNRAF
jgi:lipoate-protein ligase A